jgi:hypothetical protein
LQTNSAINLNSRIIFVAQLLQGRESLQPVQKKVKLGMLQTVRIFFFSFVVNSNQECGLSTDAMYEKKQYMYLFTPK